jgi:LacI family transcriptional regulator
LRQSGSIARLRDVAAAASVSVAAVSRYLNGSLHLPQETARRIEAAIARLDYRPNPHARRLSTGRTDTIGLVIPSIDNPFFAKLADAVEASAAARGLELILCASRNQPQRELDYIAWMNRNHVDGLLFTTNHVDDGSLARSFVTATNVVLIDEDVPGAEVGKVFADNLHGGYLAGRHLIEAGHRRLGFIGGPRGMLSTTERLAGFRRAVAEAGPGYAIVAERHSPYIAPGGRQSAEAMLATPLLPTAIFITSDELTISVLEVLAARCIAVPEALSIISFDDVRPLHLFSPPISAIRQPLTEMGQAAFDLLIEASTAGKPKLPLRLPVQLIARASVTRPADP